MKANRIRFSRLIGQYELLKMRAAYVMAEDYLMKREAGLDQAENIEWVETSSMGPEEFNKLNFDAFGNKKRPMTEKERIHEQLLVLEAQLMQAEENEQYESCRALLQTIEQLRIKFTKL